MPAAIDLEIVLPVMAAWKRFTPLGLARKSGVPRSSRCARNERAQEGTESPGDREGGRAR